MTKGGAMTKAITGDLCGGKKKQGPGNCEQPAGWGTDHAGFGRCKLHGGSTTTGKAAAAEAEGRWLLGQMVPDRGPVTDPLAELRQLGALVMQWMRACESALESLNDYRYEGEHSGEQLRSEVAMFERSMDRAATFLATLAKLGLDERQVAVSEAKANMLLRALEAGLAEHGITGPQATAVKQATGRHLKVLKAA
jgi:hypothetical protein